MFALLYSLPYLLYNRFNHENINRFLSSINSSYIGITALCYNYDLVNYSALTTAVYSGVYWFGFDILYMYYTNYNTRLFYLHHILAILTILSGVTETQNPRCICMMSLCEITTIFMNLSWILYKQNLVKKYKFTSLFVDTCMMISYLNHRFSNIINLMILIHSDNALIIYNIIVFIYLLLNIYWIITTTNMLIKKYTKKINI